METRAGNGAGRMADRTGRATTERLQAKWVTLVPVFGAASGTMTPGLHALAQGSGSSGGLIADVSSCLVKPRHVIQLGSPVFGVLAGVYADRAEIGRASCRERV